MIVIKQTENGFKTYSNENYKIKPIFDRLGETINENAIFDEAEDIEVDEKPRFDYEETDIKREIEQEIEEEP